MWGCSWSLSDISPCRSRAVQPLVSGHMVIIFHFHNLTCDKICVYLCVHVLAIPITNTDLSKHGQTYYKHIVFCGKECVCMCVCLSFWNGFRVFVQPAYLALNFVTWCVCVPIRLWNRCCKIKANFNSFIVSLPHLSWRNWINTTFLGGLWEEFIFFQNPKKRNHGG